VVSPPNGTQGVGINGVIHLVFSNLVHESTIDKSTVQWTDGNGQSIPAMIEFMSWNGRTSARITPHDPFRPSVTYTLTVSGVQDLAGRAVPQLASSFTAGTSLDFQRPQLISSSPKGFGTPLNAVPAAAFDEVLSPVTVNSATVILERGIGGSYWVPTQAAVALSPDGRTILVTPAQPLEAHTEYHVILTGSIADVSGNRTDVVVFDFTTGATVDLTPLGLVVAAPADSTKNVPINQSVVLLFDSQLQSALTSQYVRIEKNGQPVASTVLVGGETIELKPQELLEPNTAYRWVAEGLRDLAGNPMAAPRSGTFTTGASIDLSPLLLDSVQPADGATNVPRNAVIAVRYKGEFNPRTVDYYLLSIRDLSNATPIKYSISYSPDLTTLYFTPTTPLPANSVIEANYAGATIGNLMGEPGREHANIQFTTGN